MTRTLNFALTYAVDAYTTTRKIMGRQSAGQGLLKAVLAAFPDGDLHAVSVVPGEAQAMSQQFKALGFRGRLRQHNVVPTAAIREVGCVYYPAPVPERIAHARNAMGPSAYSLFGVTHTLSSNEAMEGVARLALAPFQAWDAQVCTSRVAAEVVTRLQDDYRAWAATHLGATRFNPIANPVIPLGVDEGAFIRTTSSIGRARSGLKIAQDEVAFLFAGRMVFHAKANQAPFYQALEATAARSGRKIVCVEAGVMPNDAIVAAYAAARARLAPSVRFIHVDGNDAHAYRQAWQASDVFVSLADNVQETFGLTPIEAMAAAMPVLVSDWNGYKDTIRDGVDGFRVATVMPPSGAGVDLAYRHAAEIDNYDQYVGRVSFATVIDQGELVDRMVRLAQEPELRAAMGASGRARAVADYRWQTIVERYCDLAEELGRIRAAADPAAAQGQTWPRRPDPFDLFSAFSTRTLGGGWRVGVPRPLAAVESLLELNMAAALVDHMMTRDEILAVHHAAQTEGHTVATLLAALGGGSPARLRALMWLYKFDLLPLAPP